MKKIGINGFGRIGRQFVRAALEREKMGELKFKDIGLVAVNDLTDAKTLAHLLKYDTIYGKLENNIEAEEDKISIDGTPILVLSEPDPVKLPWKELGVEVVVESSGKFTKREEASKHLKAGAKKVIISAPPKGEGVNTYILGVNNDKRKSSEEVISNSSCTTNCVAPCIAVLQEKFGIKKALMTTIHGYTADQNLQDGPHRDLHRARAAAYNIIPTTTGAAISTTETIPELKGLFDGLAFRVPVITGSVSDFTLLMKRKVTAEEINQAIVEAAETPRFKGILSYTNEPIVSSDIIGSPFSSIVDLSLTKVIDDDLVKVVAWYDNELGYAYRLLELTLAISKE